MVHTGQPPVTNQGREEGRGSEGQTGETAHMYKKGFAAHFLEGKFDTLVIAISMGVGIPEC